MDNNLIHVLEPSGPPESDVLDRNLRAIRQQGFEVDYTPCSADARTRLEIQGIEIRLGALQSALDSNSRYLLSARGGYGASELLSRLDWDALTKEAPRVLIGFSDISALQSALYARLKWPSLHAPMPGSSLWQGGEDVRALLDLLRSDRPWTGSIDLAPVSNTPELKCQGRLFGGCLSVLSNLVGTPNLPSDLSGHILFFEDTGESAPRLLRYWRQWLDSGLLKGVSAVVFGRFTEMGSMTEADSWAVTELAARAPCPVFSSRDFGHVTPNLPLAIGAQAEIRHDRLLWNLDL
ncbi:MAG: S66 peptidase family protein [Arenicellales bacterium]